MLPAAPRQREGGGGIPFPFLALIVILGLGYVMIFLPERKKQKAFQDQIASLKKNDRVVTIGGIYGVVANIHREADKVTRQSRRPNQNRLYLRRDFTRDLRRHSGRTRQAGNITDEATRSDRDAAFVVMSPSVKFVAAAPNFQTTTPQ